MNWTIEVYDGTTTKRDFVGTADEATAAAIETAESLLRDCDCMGCNNCADRGYLGGLRTEFSARLVQRMLAEDGRLSLHLMSLPLNNYFGGWVSLRKV